MNRRLALLLAVGLFGPTTFPDLVRADHPRPFKGAFDFAVVDIRPESDTELVITAVMAGNGTFLGRFEGVVIYIVDLDTGTFDGYLSKYAANGDRLDETLTGRFTATGSEGDFTVTGGTGRFLNATGRGTYVNVWTDPTRTAGHVTFGGSIVFRASDRRH